MQATKRRRRRRCDDENRAVTLDLVTTSVRVMKMIDRRRNHSDRWQRLFARNYWSPLGGAVTAAPRRAESLRNARCRPAESPTQISFVAAGVRSSAYSARLLQLIDAHHDLALRRNLISSSALRWHGVCFDNEFTNYSHGGDKNNCKGIR